MLRRVISGELIHIPNLTKLNETGLFLTRAFALAFRTPRVRGLLKIRNSAPAQDRRSAPAASAAIPAVPESVCWTSGYPVRRNARSSQDGRLPPPETLLPRA